MIGWSEARIRAWKMRDTQPNAYYYRFNDPGQQQRNGKWTDDERKLFFKRMQEINIVNNPHPQWGVFSMTIPGRVGYQCANYYRALVKAGEIVDTNYQCVDGKLKYEGKRGGGPREPKRKRTTGDEDADADPGDEDFKSSAKVAPDVLQSNNPLPDFIDPITCDTIEKPAISPNGIVLGYDTWMRCLHGKDRCPLTQVPVRRRDLVVLTHDNIEEYRSMIANLC